MKKNFSVDSAVGIDIDGAFYDLHNFYNFKSLHIDNSRDEVGLLFSVDCDFNSDNGVPVEILITFQKVNYFEMSAGFVISKTVGLEEVGYKNPGDKNIDWLIGESKSSPFDHLLFRFSNDEIVRLSAENVVASVKL